MSASNKFSRYLILLCLWIPAVPAFPTVISTLSHQIAHDYQNLLTPETLKPLGILIGTAGVLANTGLDVPLGSPWQHSHSQTDDHIFHPATHFGGLNQVNNLLPLYLGSYFLGYASDNPSLLFISDWGNRSFRTLLLGAPQQFALTRLLGAARPEDGGPHWHPLRKRRGVSGHAFYGAVPFITLAQKNTDPAIRYPLYALSTLPGLARLYDHKHYTSQVLMGWGLAYLAALTVEHTNHHDMLSQPSKWAAHITPHGTFTVALQF